MIGGTPSATCSEQPSVRQVSNAVEFAVGDHCCAPKQCKLLLPSAPCSRQGPMVTASDVVLLNVLVVQARHVEQNVSQRRNVSVRDETAQKP